MLEMLSLHFCMHRAIGEAQLGRARTMLRTMGSHAPGTARVSDLLVVAQLLCACVALC